MPFSSNRPPDPALNTSLVFSATETKVHSDLIAVKASFLHSENVQLASTRLHHTLLAMRTYEKDEDYQETLQKCLDKLLARRGHTKDKRYEKRLRACLDGLVNDASLGRVNRRRTGVVMVNVPPPKAKSVLAMIELAEGFCMEAFSILSYEEVVQKTFNFMRGDVPTLEVIPVFDQHTFDRLEGFTRVTLRLIESDAPGPLAQLDDPSAYRALLANNFLEHMPDFPSANWGELFEMRDQLKSTRQKLLSKMDDLAQDLNKGATPDKISEFTRKQWVVKIRAELADIETKKKGERSPSRLVGSGLPQLAMGIGVAATVLAEHHMPYYAIGTAAALAAQQFAIEQNARRKFKSEVRLLPYWFLYHSSDRWKSPTWPEKRRLEAGESSQ